MLSQATEDINNLFQLYLKEIHPLYLSYMQVKDPYGIEKLRIDFIEDLLNNLNSPTNFFAAVSSNFAQAKAIRYILKHRRLPPDEECIKILRTSFEMTKDAVCSTQRLGEILCDYYRKVYDRRGIEKLVDNPNVVEEFKRHIEDLYKSLKDVWERKEWTQIKIE
jgi:hypothetical protein